MPDIHTVSFRRDDLEEVSTAIELLKVIKERLEKKPNASPKSHRPKPSP